MVTFTKFGSCVTSDVFNFMNISNYYPKHIYTGINIATAVHKADIPCLLYTSDAADEEDSDALD